MCKICCNGYSTIHRSSYSDYSDNLQIEEPDRPLCKKLFNTYDPDHLQKPSGSVTSFSQKVAHPCDQDYLQTMCPLGPKNVWSCTILRSTQKACTGFPKKVMSMVKFSPTALNFGYDFFLLVTFLGHPVHTPCYKICEQRVHIFLEKKEDIVCL